MWFLNLINPFNKVVDVIGAYVAKRQDVDLEKYKVNGQVNIKAMEADLAIIQARADLAKARANDPADRLARILMMWGLGVYVSVYTYWLTFANKLPEWILIEPKELTGDIKYLFMAVIAYLFVSAWKGK